MATRAILVGALLAALLIPAGGSAGLRTAPGATGQPQVSGPTVQGQTLTTTNGRWSGTRPLAFRYRWLRCDTSGGGATGVNCSPIPGETRRPLVLRGGDVGPRIRSRVIASTADGGASATSTAPPGVGRASSGAGPPVNTSPPAISG